MRHAPAVDVETKEGDPKVKVLISRKCHVEKGDLVPCSGLAAVTDINCRKGIRPQMFMNFKTGKQWHLFMVLSGDFVGKGLIMNYCPFCGEDIVSHTPAGQSVHPKKDNG